MQSTTRQALPERVHQIWDCIEHSHGAAGALVDMERLLSVSSAIHKIPKEEFEEELERAVSDGLVQSEIIDNKGSEVEVFALPDIKALVRGEHDWYCFACHLGGSVLMCEDCPRVFHLNCLPENRKPDKDLFVCPPCHMIATKPSMSKVNLKPKILNTLLTYICERFNEWQIQFLLSADPKVWAAEAKRPQKEAWRFNMLVYTPIDLTMMAEKAASGKYTSLEEFQVDCEALVHAIGSYFGTEVLKGSSTGAAFIRDALHDIQEIKLCHDCFRRSNEKDHAWWFCLPCSVPHKVVWAKQTGYPFWPAKVMKQDGNKYDVRYFGGGYERALIDSKNILPIETSLATLKVRRTALWNDAHDELNKFMEIAKNPELVNTLPSRGKGSSAKSKSPRGTKRPASPEDGLSTKKSRGSDRATPKRLPTARRSTPAGTKNRMSAGSTQLSTPVAGLSSNGLSTQHKKVSLSLKSSVTPTTTGRQSSSATPGNNATMSTLGKQESIAGVGAVLEDISFDSFFEEVGENDLTGDAAYSDDEEKAQSEKAKVSEDAVSSSCNAAVTSRNVYVQVTTTLTQTIEAAKKKFEEYHKDVQDHYIREISANKKKQWCFNCEREAIYHCCWNTSYCSTQCQQQHWSESHKKNCRRVRRERSGDSGATGHGDDY